MRRTLVVAVVVLSLAAARLDAQEKKQKKAATPPQPTPTAAKVAYGTHERQVLDFWQAKSDRPTPLVLYIHGGGWRAGDKALLSAAAIKQCLAAGVSVAAINYRYTHQAAEAKVEPPVKAPLEDAARALQFLRSKSAEWNLDKKRIGATGGSAGACSSLWLAFHDDLADPKSDDPVARESTRLSCAAVSGAQTSLDPKELREWIPNYVYGAHAFGLKDFPELHAKRDTVLKWIKEYSPIEHVTKDDPPIFMEYPSQKVPPKLGEKQSDPTHSAVMGLKLEERLKEAGVEVILVYPGRTHPQYRNSFEYLIDRLRK
jgi:acetyl esterase/lipase